MQRRLQAERRWPPNLVLASQTVREAEVNRIDLLYDHKLSRAYVHYNIAAATERNNATVTYDAEALSAHEIRVAMTGRHSGWPGAARAY